jgi:hypothetical protein
MKKAILTNGYYPVYEQGKLTMLLPKNERPQRTRSLRARTRTTTGKRIILMIKRLLIK